MVIDIELVRETLKYAAFVATKTETTLDDKLVAGIQAVLENEAIAAWLADLLDKWFADSHLVMAADRMEPPTEVAAEIDRLGLDLATILALIRLIKEIIDMFRGQK